MKENTRIWQLANHILAVANRHNILVTSLKLKPVLYYTFKYGLQQGILTEKDYDKPFLAWRYGPVVQDIITM